MNPEVAREIEALERVGKRGRESGGRLSEIPVELCGEPVEDDSQPRTWCSSCGLPDAPVDHYQNAMRGLPPPECSRCGSLWRWYGRLADRDGTATEPPTGECLECYRWARYGPGQEHFGWTWWRICVQDCPHEHHEGEIALAAG